MHTQMVRVRIAQAQRNAPASWAASQTANHRKAQILTHLPAPCADLTEFGTEEEEEEEVVSVAVGELNTE